MADKEVGAGGFVGREKDAVVYKFLQRKDIQSINSNAWDAFLQSGCLGTYAPEGKGIGFSRPGKLFKSIQEEQCFEGSYERQPIIVFVRHFQTSSLFKITSLPEYASPSWGMILSFPRLVDQS